MALSSSARAAFLAVFCIAQALCACTQGATTTSGSAVVTDFGSDSTESRFRASGARETTLAAFCKSPPKTTTPEGAEAIRASCRPQVLGLVGDAAVFDKGNGIYPVVFKRPVRNGDICPVGTPPQSICGNFSAGDRMHSSRIDAG
jgi:hypothetical protein